MLFGLSALQYTQLMHSNDVSMIQGGDVLVTPTNTASTPHRLHSNRTDRVSNIKAGTAGTAVHASAVQPAYPEGTSSATALQTVG